MVISGYTGNFNPSVLAVVPISTQVSNVIPTGGFKLVGITTPAALTSTTITFSVCDTVDGTFVPLNNSSGAVSYTVAAGNHYAINPSDFDGVAFFQINTGSYEAAQRTLTLSMKG